jgi:two-component system KDP operon response regulator KdpE
VRILVVDDEPGVRESLARVLDQAGYQVIMAADGRDALHQVALDPPDAMVLDVVMPGLDGIEVTRSLRLGRDHTPVLLLTARAEVSDRVRGLDAGADDYLTKPFGMDELLARIRAMMRRSGRGEDEAPVVQLGENTIDLVAHKVLRNGAEVRLTPTEWHLLEVLARHPGRLLSQRRLLAEVWGPGYERAQGNLRLYMGQLRRKLESDPARPRHLLNEPGMGYRFEP